MKLVWYPKITHTPWMGALSTHYASIHISACTAQRIVVWLWKYGLLSPLCVINKNKKSEGRWLLILRHSNVLTCVHHVKMLDHLGICTIFLIILKIRTYPKHSGPLLVVKIWKRSKNALPHLRPKTTIFAKTTPFTRLYLAHHQPKLTDSFWQAEIQINREIDILIAPN